MNKGIAIRTILLLLSGIIVAGIVIYLFFIYTRTSIISESECRARLSEICMLCKNNGWSGYSHDGGFWGLVDECASYPSLSSFSCPTSGTCDCGTLESPCKMLGVE